MTGKIKNMLLAASAGMVLGTPAMAKSTSTSNIERKDSPVMVESASRPKSDSNMLRFADGTEMSEEDFINGKYEFDHAKERSGVEKHFDWEVRIPVRSGIKRFSVNSLDEVLSNPELKNHVYSPGVAGEATPLSISIINNDLGLMQKCIDAGVDPNKGNRAEDETASPLAKAVNSYTNLVKMGKDPSIARKQVTALLQAGANPNTVIYSSPGEVLDGVKIEPTRETPLHAMAKIRDNEMIDLLLSYGADTSAKSAGRTPLDEYKVGSINYTNSLGEGRGENKPEMLKKLEPKSSFFSLFSSMYQGGGR